jgi:ankyrin repeat protein
LLLAANEVEADSSHDSGNAPALWPEKNDNLEAMQQLFTQAAIRAWKARYETMGQPLSTQAGVRAAKAGSETMGRLLVRREEVDVNLKDNRGRTPLSWAVQRGHKEVVMLLLGQHDLNAVEPDHNGRTPLWYAEENGFKDIMMLLNEHLSMHADLDDDEDGTAIQVLDVALTSTESEDNCENAAKRRKFQK